MLPKNTCAIPFICGLIHNSLYDLRHETMDGKDVFFISRFDFSNTLPTTVAINTTPQAAIDDLVDHIGKLIPIKSPHDL